MSCTGAALILRNCVFKMTPTSKPPTIGGVLYSYSYVMHFYVIIMENITVDVQDFMHPMSIASLTALKINLKEIRVLCPKSLRVVLRNDIHTLSVSCVSSCPGEYSLQSGNVTIVDERDNNVLFF